MGTIAKAATVLIGTWTRQIDKARVREVLSGARPFDESTLTGGHGADAGEKTPVAAQGDMAAKPMATTAR